MVPAPAPRTNQSKRPAPRPDATTEGSRPTRLIKWPPGCHIIMKTCMTWLCALLLHIGAVIQVHAMAGDLKRPSLAFPENTPAALRTQLLAALEAEECKFMDGHFINANTTLRYGGSTESLNRLLARLSECEGIQINVTFTNEPGGAAWTITHNGWADADQIGVQVNLGATTLKLEQLGITVRGKGQALNKSAEAAKPH